MYHDEESNDYHYMLDNICKDNIVRSSKDGECRSIDSCWKESSCTSHARNTTSDSYHV